MGAVFAAGDSWSVTVIAAAAPWGMATCVALIALVVLQRRRPPRNARRSAETSSGGAAEGDIERPLRGLLMVVALVCGVVSLVVATGACRDLVEARDVRLALASRPLLPYSAAVELITDPSTRVRAVAASNTTSPGLLAGAAEDTASVVRAAVAANPATPADVLRSLVSDPEHSVRLAVAANPSTPSEAVIETARRTRPGS